MSESNADSAAEEARRIEIQNKDGYIFWGCCASGVIAIILIAGVIMWSVHVSLDAERNLHSTRFVIRLVEQFVNDNQRWPTSWKELEATNSPRHIQSDQLAAMFGPWPACAQEVEQRVVIDFQPDLKAVTRQDRMDFVAIKPKGRHYEYRDYGDVDELLRTLSLSISGLKGK